MRVVGRAIWGLLAAVVTLGVAAPVAQASLGVPTGGPSVPFTSLAAFEAAAGGADNGTTAGDQATGFRHVTWDGIAVNGTEPGSTAIPGGHTVAVARSRVQPWGLELGPGIAVANDGFHSVSSNANFTPFSRQNVWGPFNSGTAELDVVAPADQGSTATPAQTRGLGIVFLNANGSTNIQYYNGDILLDSISPSPGATSFAGRLFPDPVVTRVVVTLGGGQIFAYDGSTVSGGGANPVAADDVALAEPAPARGAVAATAGVPVSAPLDTFTETNPNARPQATIDWGDGARTLGTIAAGPGGTFLVTGNHAYAQTGSYLARVTVDDSSGPEQTREIEIQVGPRTTTTNVTCSPSPVAVTAAATCTATVSDVDGGSASPPAGLVSFSSMTSGAAFPQAAGCLLGPAATPGVSLCAVHFTPGQLPPHQARVAAAYGGDAAHAPSNATAILGVRAGRCSLRTLSRRLRPAGLGVLVTCDARANVQIAGKAVAARRGPVRGFQLRFGSLRSVVTAGRPTVLVIKPSSAVLRSLRAALRRHQRVSLKLTLTASSHATQRTTTTRLPALRVS